MLDQNQAWRYRVKKIMRVIKIVFSIAFILALLFAIYVIIYLIKYGDLQWGLKKHSKTLLKQDHKNSTTTAPTKDYAVSSPHNLVSALMKDEHTRSPSSQAPNGDHGPSKAAKPQHKSTNHQNNTHQTQTPPGQENTQSYAP